MNYESEKLWKSVEMIVKKYKTINFKATHNSIYTVFSLNCVNKIIKTDSNYFGKINFPSILSQKDNKNPLRWLRSAEFDLSSYKSQFGNH